MSTSTYRAEVYQYVTKGGTKGATVAEAREALNGHHGHTSGCLSLLHQDGRLARLSEKRNGCKVYVHPEHVAGRETEPQGRGHTMPRRILEGV